MATCTNTIQPLIDNNQIDTITPLYANTLTNITLIPSTKQLLLMDIVKQETVKFTISLVAISPPTNIGVSVNIYSYNEENKTITFVGSAAITEMIMTFQKDFSPGKYILCIGTTTFSYTGTIVGQFTGFQIFSKLIPRVYAGDTFSIELTSTHRDRTCNKNLFYEIIDGELPPGLHMTQLGNIEGILPNMDCIQENDDLSPSQNWYYNLGNTWYPWGRQWRFQIKVWVFDYPEAYTTDWFCIRVHNNWSLDKDNLRPPFDYEVKSLETFPEIELNSDCCEDNNIVVPFTPMPIPSICPCAEETPVEKAIVLNFLQWYYSVLQNPSDSPDVLKFIDEFEKSAFYATLIKKAGLEETLMTKEQKELITFETLIEKYTNELIGGRGVDHTDYVMMQIRDQENQKLPITPLSQIGEFLTVNIV